MIILSKCNCENNCLRYIYSPFCRDNNQILLHRKAFKTLENVLRGKAKDDENK